ncbi:MAG: DUF1207 domain-containing protein [Planctomycetes bacterium]|nr:DUF1207 domain-containing protein [Planctomycetota bacterium]
MALFTACAPSADVDAVDARRPAARPEWMQGPEQEPEPPRGLQPSPALERLLPPASEPEAPVADAGSGLVAPADLEALSRPASPFRPPLTDPLQEVEPMGVAGGISGHAPLELPPSLLERRAGLDGLPESDSLGARVSQFEALAEMSPDATTVFVGPGRANFEWHGGDLAQGVRPVMTFGLQAWETQQLQTDLSVGVGLEFATGDEWSLRTLFEYYEGPWSNGYRLAEDLRYYGLSVGVRF